MRWFCLIAVVFLASCVSRPLPKFEKPLPRTEYQRVRTTAYTHSERDHRKYKRFTARGTQLQSGQINSAAADWARWPVGTVFRVCETGKLYEVDDYGWALSGTNTIDLYTTNRREMNRWGVRRVTIQVLHWGSLRESRQILYPRRKYAHVKRMLKEMD